MAIQKQPGPTFESGDKVEMPNGIQGEIRGCEWYDYDGIKWYSVYWCNPDDNYMITTWYRATDLEPAV